MVRCSTSNHGSAVAHGGVILRLFHRVFNAWKCNSPNNDLLELKSIDACASLKSRKPDAESKSAVVEVARSTSHHAMEQKQKKQVWKQGEWTWSLARGLCRWISDAENRRPKGGRFGKKVEEKKRKMREEGG